MELSSYHQQYIDQSDDQIARKAQVKDGELAAIFARLGLVHGTGAVRVAVLGCGDRRLVAHHRRLFEKYLGRPVELLTYDIATEHLKGEKGVKLHDCTQPLPDPPYDVTYGHVVLKFIQADKQWDLIRNSFESLSPGGVAIHVLDREEIDAKEPRLSDGLCAVPLERWKRQLDEENVEHTEVPLKHGLALVIKR